MAYLVVSHLLCKYIKHQQLTASAGYDGGYVHVFSSGRKNKSGIVPGKTFFQPQTYWPEHREALFLDHA